MKSINKLQVGIIAGAIALFVLLYFANKKPVKKAEDVMGQNASGAVKKIDLNAFTNAKIAGLNDSLKLRFNTLNKQVSATDTVALDAVVQFWDRLMMPDVASVFVEKKALVLKTAKAWVYAGERYFYAVRFVKDPAESQALYQAAINCYTKGLAMEPNNVAAKINLAACYVDGTTDPMKGIGMLKEIEKTDSSNISLQLTFALFSAKSQQWPKAISRYQKVIRLKPDFLEAYLYLADAYEKSGDTVKTIETLEKYVSLSPDKEMSREVKKYIEKLKTNH